MGFWGCEYLAGCAVKLNPGYKNVCVAQIQVWCMIINELFPLPSFIIMQVIYPL